MGENEKATNGNAQYLALMDSLDSMDRTLKEIHKEALDAPDIRSRIITVKASEEAFSTEGYKYFGIIVSAPQTLTVTAFNFSYDLSLDPGFNPITLIDGTTYKSANGVAYPCVFVWSSVPIGETTTGTTAKFDDIILQSAVTAAANGTAFNVGGYRSLTLEITGTSTSRTIIFEGSNASGAYTPITAVKPADLTTGTQTTGNNEVWQLDITGYVTVRARVSAVAGGNVTITGRVVA